MNLVVVDGVVTRVDRRTFGNGGECIEVHMTTSDEKWNRESKRMEHTDVPLKVDCFGKAADSAKAVREGDYVMVQGRLSGRYSEGKGGQKWHNTSVSAVTLRVSSSHVSRPPAGGARPAPQGDDDGTNVPF